MQEAIGAPAVTVFGRTFDFRTMLRSSPVRGDRQRCRSKAPSVVCIQIAVNILQGLAYRAIVIVAMLLQVDFRRILDLSVWPSGGSDDDSLETAATRGRQRRATNSAPAEDGAAPRRHPAAEALRRGGHAALGFGFSAGGLLFPYYIGVMYGLHDLGVITRTCLNRETHQNQHSQCYMHSDRQLNHPASALQPAIEGFVAY